MKRIAPFLVFAFASWLIAVMFGLLRRSPAFRAELARRGIKLPVTPAEEPLAPTE
jgi:hypothetical protein